MAVEPHLNLLKPFNSFLGPFHHFPNLIKLCKKIFLYYVNTLLNNSYLIYVLIKLRRICLPAHLLRHGEPMMDR